MRVYKGLIRAELLQHRSGMIITPLVIAGLIGLFFMAQLIFNTSGVDLALGQFKFSLDNETVLNPDTVDAAGNAIAAGFGFIGIPVFLVANVVAFFVLLSALYEERTERTILFFKSMPVSDTQSVLAKYVTAAFIGPLIAIVVMFALAAILSIATALVFTMRGVADFTAYLGHLPLLKLFISFSGYYFLYAQWVAPIFAYLLMMSALAPRSPFLYALLPIAVLSLAEGIFFGSAQFWTELNARAFGVRLNETIKVSRGWVDGAPERSIDSFFIRFGDIAATIMSPSVWLGIGVAAAFLAVAIWARSRKTL